MRLRQPVLGVDGCRAGWVGVLLEETDVEPSVLVHRSVAALVAAATRIAPVAVVGVDIPIGLPDAGLRQADVLARRALPGKASSVFSTLTRAAYQAPDRAAASLVNERLTGQKVGAQAFSLRDKILEVDAWVRAGAGVPVVEVHPEVSFAAMAGAPIAPPKRRDEGRLARVAALTAAGVRLPAVLTGRGYAADDLLDACAVAWTARRVLAGVAHTLPDPPERFSDGIAAAIHV